MTQHSDNAAQLPPVHVQEATQWHTLMHADDEVTQEDKVAFGKWYAIVKNAEAYQQLERIWESFDSVDEKQERKVLEDVLSDHGNDKKTAKFSSTMFSIVLLVCSITLGLQLTPNDGLVSEYILSGRLFSDHSTSVGEQRVMVLSDQTRIHLNTFTSINIEYTDNQRSIHLLQGEISLDVAKDAARPLVVISDQGTARALGTKFTVREQGNTMHVAVIESRVEVCASVKAQVFASHQCQQLGAGESTQVSQASVEKTMSINTSFHSDWSQQQLVVDNQPLLQVLDELNRYQLGYLRIDRQALAPLKVSGVFPLDDIERSLQVLADSLPIRVNTYTPLLIVIERK